MQEPPLSLVFLPSNRPKYTFDKEEDGTFVPFGVLLLKNSALPYINAVNTVSVNY